ncbi:MAG: alpha/beta fold hydrolase [Solirubrobacterales bacterium]
MQTRTATINSIPMRWEEQGEGTPVVLVHGIPTSPALWRHVVPRISGARCLAWEMVGYGHSGEQGAGRDISVARQAEYLHAWMDHLDLDGAVLVGHDLGGGVAQVAAVRDPSRLRGLVLTNCISYDSWPVTPMKVIATGAPVVSRLPNAVFSRMLERFYRPGHDTADQAREAYEAHWPGYRDSGGAAAFARQAQSLDSGDTEAIAGQLPQLSLPARLVWGTGDDFQPVSYGRRLADDLGAELREIDGAKHFTPEDHPEPIAEAIDDLLREVG